VIDAGVGPFTLANGLTALRIVLAPIFLVLYVRGDSARALAAFAAAAASDVLDGLVARALRQRTRLGAMLDPIADKFLAACALVALTATGHLPPWLPVLVVGRDLLLVAGAGLLRWLRGAGPFSPTRIGKYATFAVAVTVLVALAGDFGALPRTVADPYVVAFALLGSLCVVLSFLQYGLFFLRSLRTPAVAGLAR
jgi:cardiolipin synthase